MKKIILIGMVAFAALSSSNASAQAVEEGKILVDVYYGFPNLYTTVFKTAYANSGQETNLKIGGLGPLGLRGEYLLTDKFGIGLDLGYSQSKVSYVETDFFDGKDYTYDFKTSKIGVMATFNYHFLDHDKVDFYGVFGVGYGNRTFSFTSTDPNYVEASIKSLIPVASRIGVGLRYFFTDNIGANLGIGFGQGGVINAGISAKF